MKFNREQLHNALSALKQVELNVKKSMENMCGLKQDGNHEKLNAVLLVEKEFIKTQYLAVAIDEQALEDNPELREMDEEIKRVVLCMEELNAPPAKACQQAAASSLSEPASSNLFEVEFTSERADLIIQFANNTLSRELQTDVSRGQEILLSRAFANLAKYRGIPDSVINQWNIISSETPEYKYKLCFTVEGMGFLQLLLDTDFLPKQLDEKNRLLQVIPLLQEAITTEDSYIKTLQFLVREQPKLAGSWFWFSKNHLTPELNVLFAKLPQLITLGESLKKNVEDSRLFMGVLSSEAEKSTKSLSTQRIQIIKAFSLIYFEYLKAYEAYQKTQVGSDPIILSDKRTLDECLIVPIQRAPRYVLLIQAMLKYHSGMFGETTRNACIAIIETLDSTMKGKSAPFIPTAVLNTIGFFAQAPVQESAAAAKSEIILG